MRADERVVMEGKLLKQYFFTLGLEDGGYISQKTLKLGSKYGS